MKFIKLNTANMIAVSELESIQIERNRQSESEYSHMLVAYSKKGMSIVLGKYFSEDTANESLTCLTNSLNGGE